MKGRSGKDGEKCTRISIGNRIRERKKKSEECSATGKQTSQQKRGLAQKVVLSILAVCSVICIMYCISVFFMGFGTKFFLIWGAMGVCLMGVCLLQWRFRAFTRLPKWLRRTGLVLILLGTAVFIWVEALILTQFHAYPAPGADYCVILGAQWKRTGPSIVLQRRLEMALTYLKENPGTGVIVSGGQGANEIITEAAGMKQYLMEHGIEEDRIFEEDQSVNTTQNLQFSAKYLDLENDRVVIVTNNFHMYRALKIAKKQGYQACGLAATSVKAMIPNNMLREFFGVVKDFLAGNL